MIQMFLDIMDPRRQWRILLCRIVEVVMIVGEVSVNVIWKIIIDVHLWIGVVVVPEVDWVLVARVVGDIPIWH